VLDRALVRCYTVITLVLHWGHCRHTAVTLFLHCSYTVFTLLLQLLDLLAEDNAIENALDVLDRVLVAPC
jgi:hypothetical protein